ncbi:filamentous hemagglutinin N-terminal domain-containing protein [Candidatus Parabeggiatoa sp. HSG14]|uniref:two-partner secretion domain-containing protein n=1 Tax=Candidatus Parabeggiatoa sp. HSG14 TaxID=3055593 RepID=UPI0025A69440|nr:filamentous hemagglutinin N-terminal domain-containing protein [Thiotrichales bacterium HSG14]
MKSPHLLTIVLLIISLSVNAEITTDGSLGSRANLPGPNYLIGADLGQQLGNNLFHSFQDFNLNSSESATFSGQNTVQNILSRVTGGNPSNIDGLIRSTIPNADFYFLNPNGIMFGPNAKLDVQGSFHASTADYLRLGENGRFDARNPSDSLLTVAPVETFGFLDNTVAPISIQGKGKINQIDIVGLAVSEGKTLSLIGGNINISNGSFTINDGNDDSGGFISEYDQKTNLADIAAPSGRINLVAIASAGEVELGNDFIDISSFSKLADLHIIDKSVIQTSGEGGGSIFIRGHTLKLIDSMLENNTLGQRNGGIISIRLNNLFAEDSSKISAEAMSIGNSGSIDIMADKMHLLGAASITTNTLSKGKGGNINIKVNGDLDIFGQSQAGYSSVISASATNMSTGTGDAGYLWIQAENLTLKDGGTIASSSFALGKGNGGNIIIDVTDTLMIDDGFTIPHPMFAKILPHLALLASAIAATANGGANAGTINVTARKIILSNGGAILSNTQHSGKAGSINIKATEDLIIKGYYVGRIVFHSGLESNSMTPRENAGDAGSISVQANRIYIDDEGTIATTAVNAGGGNIHIEASNLLYSNLGQVTTSVYGGKGDGGNIIIKNPMFVVLNQGQVKAQADAGHGGNIRIVAEQFITSPDSLISASSKLGIDGDVQINSPDVDVEGFLVVLQGGYVEEAQLKQCTREEIDNPSTFKVDLTRKKVLPFEKFLKSE